MVEPSQDYQKDFCISQRRMTAFGYLIGLGTPRSNVALDSCTTQTEGEELVRGFFCRDASVNSR